MSFPSMNKKTFYFIFFLVVASVHAQESELISLLQPYNVKGVSNTKARFGRDFDGGYIVPKIILENSDVIMSYGVGDDVSFEIDIINKFNKNIYAFDCGVREVPVKNNKLYFFSECIGTDKTINSDQISSNKISSYNKQIERLKLEKSKVFIKMDIEGGEYSSFYSIKNDLLKNIQGIVIEMHDLNNNPAATKLLKYLNSYFVIVHLHANNNTLHYNNDVKAFPSVIEITYVNIKYAKHKTLSKEIYPTSLDMPNDPSIREIILDYWKKLLF